MIKSINPTPVRLTFFTPVAIYSSKWETIADLTRFKKEGVDPDELLKHL